MASFNGCLAIANPQDAIPFDDSAFTEMEKDILWIALRELKGISASWDARAASETQSEVAKVSLSESRVQYKTSMSSDVGDASTRHGSSHGSSHGSYESSRRQGSSQGSNHGSDDNSRRHGSNDSNDKSGDEEGSNTGNKSGDEEGSNPGSSGQYSEDPSGPSAEEPVPSEGSILHSRGTCRPCIYACKDKCQAGSQCSFCHYPHEMPKRPGKNARRRAMRRIRRANGEGEETSEAGDTEDGDTDASPLTDSPTRA